MPLQDTKWHKVPLSGTDTKWHNIVCHLVSSIMFVTMETTKIAIFMLIKKVTKKLLVLGKLFRITGVSMATKSYNQLLEFGNHGNK